MRIAVFADNYFPQINGVVTATHAQTLGLAKRGYHILLIVPKYKRHTYTSPHKNIKLLPIASLPALFYQDLKVSAPFSRAIVKALTSFKPDVLHFHTPLTLGFQAIMMSKIFNIPLVGTFHTYFAHTEYLKHARLNYKAIQSLAWDYANLLYNRCTHITTPSNITKKELQAQGCKRPITTISNGIQIVHPTKEHIAAQRKKLSPKNEVLILFVGRISHEKNIANLIEACKLARQDIANLKLILVGDGPQVKDVRKCIREHSMQKSIQYLGAIPHEKLMESGIIPACDIFVTASETETQGITLLEAMMQGIPCIGPKAGGIQEIIQHRKNGLFARSSSPQDLAEAIYELASNYKLYATCKKNAPAITKKHSMPAILDAWEHVYKQAKSKKKVRFDSKLIANKIKSLLRISS